MRTVLPTIVFLYGVAAFSPTGWTRGPRVAPRRCTVRQSLGGSPRSDAFLEGCILNAASEDEVQACMQLEDQRREAQTHLEHLEASLSRRSPPMRDAGLIRAKANAATRVDSERSAPTDLEECIVNAESEDGVQDCMQMHEKVFDAY